MSPETYESFLRLSSAVGRIVGIVGIAFVTIFWALTGRLAPELLGLFGTLGGAGLGLDAIRELTAARRQREDEIR